MYRPFFPHSKGQSSGQMERHFFRFRVRKSRRLSMVGMIMEEILISSGVFCILCTTFKLEMERRKSR